VACFTKKTRLSTVKCTFGASAHCEPTRSEAALEYVWKEETRVSNTMFELGHQHFNRARTNDWNAILDGAKAGDYSSIPPDVLIRSYHALKSITKDNLAPLPVERTVHVFWGSTGTGKSRRAWEEAGWGAFPKDPCTKFWDGYQGQLHVVIDEFRGSIGISHMLRWLDRYPVIVEAKHGATTLAATHVWITSNLSPRDWYPAEDQATVEALLRRLHVVHFAMIE